MTAVLDKVLRRAVKINGADYVLTLSPTGLKLTLKKKRKGLELKWADLIDGEAALASALNASLGQLSASIPQGRASRGSPSTEKTNRTTFPRRSARTRH